MFLDVLGVISRLRKPPNHPTRVRAVSSWGIPWFCWSLFWKGPVALGLSCPATSGSVLWCCRGAAQRLATTAGEARNSWGPNYTAIFSGHPLAMPLALPATSKSRWQWWWWEEEEEEEEKKKKKKKQGAEVPMSLPLPTKLGDMW